MHGVGFGHPFYHRKFTAGQPPGRLFRMGMDGRNLPTHVALSLNAEAVVAGCELFSEHLLIIE